MKRASLRFVAVRAAGYFRALVESDGLVHPVDVVFEVRQKLVHLAGQVLPDEEVVDVAVLVLVY